MNCPVCSLDIALWDIDARSAHVNSCIDKPPQPPTACSASQPPVVDLDDEEGEKPSYNIVNKFTCPLCGNLFFSLPVHLLKCGPKHDVPPPDLAALIEAAKIAAKHSSIPKKAAAAKTSKPRKPRQKKATDETKPTRRRKKKDSEPEPDPATTATDDIQTNGESSGSLVNGSKSSNGIPSKYMSTGVKDQNKVTPMAVKNGRIVAMKTLFTCDEVEVRINKMFSGTIPCNHLSTQDSFSSQESSNSTQSLCQAFGAASFLTEESFTAKGFAKYICDGKGQSREKN